MRRELSHILPDLFPLDPLPWRDPADRIRLFAAMAEAVGELRRQAGVLVMDDLQYLDAASAEAWAYMLSKLALDASGPRRYLGAYRQGELSAEAQAIVDGLVQAGLAVRILLPSPSTQ